LATSDLPFMGVLTLTTLGLRAALQLKETSPAFEIIQRWRVATVQFFGPKLKFQFLLCNLLCTKMPLRLSSLPSTFTGTLAWAMFTTLAASRVIF